MNRGAGKVLPWSLVATISLTLSVAGMAAYFLAGPNAARGAIAGAIVGFFAALMGNRLRAVAASVAVILAAAASLTAPEWVTLLVVIPVMSALVGWESGTIGSRCFVFALFAWIMLDARAVPAGDGSLVMAFALAALFGIVAAVGTGKEGMRPPTPGGRFYGVGVFVSLTAGLIITLLVTTLFTDANAHWVMLMFAMRAFAAPGTHADSALRFAVGTVLGATVAGAALDLPVPMVALQLTGVACLLMGLRVLPGESPLASALISAGVIFIVAPNQDSAVFRLEAAVIAASLAVAFNWLFDRLQVRFSR